MTKKNYIMIAAAINKTLKTLESPRECNGVKAIAYELCNVMIADNPRFDRERFLKACGLG